jgi:hypothetical protein
MTDTITATLCDASSRNDAAGVRQALRGGGDPNAPGPTRGFTALVEALLTDSADAVDILLAWPGTNVNQQDERDGRPLLDMCWCYKHADHMVGKLLDAGADPNLTDDRGWNLLHTASFYGHVSPIEALRRHAGHRLRLNVPVTGGAWPGDTALDLALWTAAMGNIGAVVRNAQRTVTYLRSVGALTKTQVEHVHRCWRKLRLYARTVGRFLVLYRAAATRVAFRPHGVGYNETQREWVALGGRR